MRTGNGSLLQHVISFEVPAVRTVTMTEQMVYTRLGTGTGLGVYFRPNSAGIRNLATGRTPMQLSRLSALSLDLPIKSEIARSGDTVSVTLPQLIEALRLLRECSCVSLERRWLTGYVRNAKGNVIPLCVTGRWNSMIFSTGNRDANLWRWKGQYILRRTHA
jgi:hypothetical protein